MALGMAYQMLVSADGTRRRFVYVSESCMVLNGVSAAAAMGDSSLLYGLIAPEDQARLAAAEAEAIASHTSFDIEVQFQRPDGEPRWNRIASAPRSKSEADGSILWDGIQIDITDKKAIELELAEQRRRVELAVEATGLGFWEWDIRTQDLSWSDRNRELFGLPKGAELSIAGYMEAVHPEDREIVRGAYRGARDDPQSDDFSMEYRAVLPDGGIRWILAHARVISDEAGPRLVVGTSLDVTERRAAEERRALLMRELAHRVKNGLSVITAIASQSARGAASVEDYAEIFTARLQAMAQSQDLVTEAGGRPFQLGELVGKLIAPFGPSRFELDPKLAEIRITGETGFGVSLVIHELATNAVKYGALSNATGQVAVTCQDCGGPLSVVEWRETGGPAVAATGRRGFGSRLMEQALRQQGGKVEPRMEPTGVVVRMEIPSVAPKPAP